MQKISDIYELKFAKEQPPIYPSFYVKELKVKYISFIRPQNIARKTLGIGQSPL